MGTILFLVIGVFSLIIAFVLEGGELGGLLVGTAAMIVFGGTLGAVGVAFPWRDVKRFPSILRKAFTEPPGRATDVILYFVDVANIARKQGILALEGLTKSKEDLNPLTRVGLQLVADGTEPQLIKEILELYVDNRQERHHDGFAMLEAAGGFAPTMGIIGTVMGLVHVLGNLSDPGKLGPSIAVAFIATLYGVSSANLIWLPLGARLKAQAKFEAMQGQMIVEGVMLISQGVSPRIVEEKLQAYLDPEELEKFTELWEAPRAEATA
ncbi:MAG TPA: flagellar motor protein [bacterium]|nr:flagellar motor protein [bacterium]